MGPALRGDGRDDGSGRRAAEGLRRLATRAVRRAIRRAARAAVALLLAAPAVGSAQALDTAGSSGALRLDSIRFTVVAYPRDEALARSLLALAVREDSFPGLPRPRARVLVQIAPDARRFREWIGPRVPEWGAAVAFPDQSRIVMQGRRAGSSAGDPARVLRHELAHLALHEALGDLPPRWFDEGYASVAAREWDREEVLAANLGLAVYGVPTLDSLDAAFHGGSLQAQTAYALAHRAVAELEALDPERGLTLFFAYWRETGKFDQAVRRAYGVTADGFENRWRRRTRLRYGGLALFADFTIAALILALVIGPVYIVRRRRDRRRMEALVRADEEADRRERESAIEALLGSLPPGGGGVEGR